MYISERITPNMYVGRPDHLYVPWQTLQFWKVSRLEKQGKQQERGLLEPGAFGPLGDAGRQLPLAPLVSEAWPIAIVKVCIDASLGRDAKLCISVVDQPVTVCEAILQAVLRIDAQRVLAKIVGVYAALFDSDSEARLLGESLAINVCTLRQNGLWSWMYPPNQATRRTAVVVEDPVDNKRVRLVQFHDPSTRFPMRLAHIPTLTRLLRPLSSPTQPSQTSGYYASAWSVVTKYEMLYFERYQEMASISPIAAQAFSAHLFGSVSAPPRFAADVRHAAEHGYGDMPRRISLVQAIDPSMEESRARRVAMWLHPSRFCIEQPTRSSGVRIVVGSSALVQTATKDDAGPGGIAVQGPDGFACTLTSWLPKERRLWDSAEATLLARALARTWNGVFEGREIPVLFDSTLTVSLDVANDAAASALAAILANAIGGADVLAEQDLIEFRFDGNLGAVSKQDLHDNVIQPLAGHTGAHTAHVGEGSIIVRLALHPDKMQQLTAETITQALDSIPERWRHRILHVLWRGEPLFGTWSKPTNQAMTQTKSADQAQPSHADLTQPSPPADRVMQLAVGVPSGPPLPPPFLGVTPLVEPTDSQTNGPPPPPPPPMGGAGPPPPPPPPAGGKGNRNPTAATEPVVLQRGANNNLVRVVPLANATGWQTALQEMVQKTVRDDPGNLVGATFVQFFEQAIKRQKKALSSPQRTNVEQATHSDGAWIVQRLAYLCKNQGIALWYVQALVLDGIDPDPELFFRVYDAVESYWLWPAIASTMHALGTTNDANPAPEDWFNAWEMVNLQSEMESAESWVGRLSPPATTAEKQAIQKWAADQGGAWTDEMQAVVKIVGNLHMPVRIDILQPCFTPHLRKMTKDDPYFVDASKRLLTITDRSGRAALIEPILAKVRNAFEGHAAACGDVARAKNTKLAQMRKQLQQRLQDQFNPRVPPLTPTEAAANLATNAMPIAHTAQGLLRWMETLATDPDSEMRQMAQFGIRLATELQTVDAPDAGGAVEVLRDLQAKVDRRQEQLAEASSRVSKERLLFAKLLAPYGLTADGNEYPGIGKEKDNKLNAMLRTFLSERRPADDLDRFRTFQTATEGSIAISNKVTTYALPWIETSSKAAMCPWPAADLKGPASSETWKRGVEQFRASYAFATETLPKEWQWTPALSDSLRQVYDACSAVAPRGGMADAYETLLQSVIRFNHAQRDAVFGAVPTKVAEQLQQDTEVTRLLSGLVDATAFSEALSSYDPFSADDEDARIVTRLYHQALARLKAELVRADPSDVQRGIGKVVRLQTSLLRAGCPTHYRMYFQKKVAKLQETGSVYVAERNVVPASELLAPAFALAREIYMIGSWGEAVELALDNAQKNDLVRFREDRRRNVLTLDAEL